MLTFVDTDFGFDDLWALLLLRHLDIKVHGVSLVAGVVPLPQVISNALSARQFFEFDWPLSAGAATPISRSPETAIKILGDKGMRSRGQHLPEPVQPPAPDTGLAGLLKCNPRHSGGYEVLALGPLTNLAIIYRDYPEQARNIMRITWMGGSAGRGNHTEYAEYNAIADPEALDFLLRANAPLRIIDLEICRQVTFTEAHMPVMHGSRGGLLRDLLGGYLDIALSRGRAGMSIYDPVASLALASAASIRVSPLALSVCTVQDQYYGQTRFTMDQKPNVELATEIDVDEALRVCFSALQQESER